MITFPNAKINLGLNIVERRPDGYHNLETVFYPIPLTDALEIVPVSGNDSTLTCHGRIVDCPPEKNLVMRAYRMMESIYKLPPVDIHLYKHIPDGAGLGGGSSDAAHTLTMLNEMFKLGLSNKQLAEIAAKLGADCPFFVYNRPMMATGIGEMLAPIDLSLQGYTLLLIKPAISVPTAEAYSRVIPNIPEQHVDELVSLPLKEWQRLLVNDFEASVMTLHPELAIIKQTLIDAGAIYAAMSGSGSSIFGIYDTDNVADKVALPCDNCDIYTLKL